MPKALAVQLAAAPAVMSHPTKAMLAGKSPLIGISIPVIDDPISQPTTAHERNPACFRRLSQGPCHKTVIKRRINEHRDIRIDWGKR